MEEESSASSHDPYCTCNYISNDSISKISSEVIEIDERKKNILTTVARTENYLKERRIPELIRFLLTMVIVHSPEKPVAFLEKLLDDCMLYRAGYGLPPVLFGDKHLQAIVKSFDPGKRGWLNAGQVHRLFETLGLTYENPHEGKVSTDLVFKNVKITQETELMILLKAGIMQECKTDNEGLPGQAN